MPTPSRLGFFVMLACWDRRFFFLKKILDGAQDGGVLSRHRILKMSGSVILSLLAT
jgi:hypothetical protein